MGFQNSCGSVFLVFVLIYCGDTQGRRFMNRSAREIGAGMALGLLAACCIAPHAERELQRRQWGGS